MDRKTAESLLRGDHPHGHPLADLLSAAKAPATDRELAGEAAAMAAFRAAAHSPAPALPRRRNPMLKLLTIKVAAVAFATTATVGGVAVAASTGALPNPIFASAPAEPSHSAPAAPSLAHSPKPSPSPSPSLSAKPSPSGSVRPHPRLDDLCEELDGRDRDGRRRALDDSRFGDLVRKAGRKDRVERFCSDLGKPRPSFSSSGRPQSQPSFSSRPGGDGDGDHDNDNDGGGFPGGGGQGY
jgi:hypothetical protein